MQLNFSRAGFGLTLLVLSACESPGPVSPNLTDSPQTAVTLSSDLKEVLAVPNIQGPQIYTYTADGLLQYQFQLQNNSDQGFFIQVRPTFFDDQGVAVDNPPPFREAFAAQEIKTLRVVCGNNRGRRVRVQISPAR